MNRYKKSYRLFKKATGCIFNSVLTLSKSPYSLTYGACPVYVERAQGAYFWDVDGNKYIDYPMALGPVVLGYANNEVDAAVKKQMSKGFLYSLSNKQELELAEILCRIIPSAGKVRILKTGSEAMSAAVRIARAYTGKEVIAVCGYHGWHDWTITRSPRNAGVPKDLKPLCKEFKYNDLTSLEEIFSTNKNNVAAVVMEPVGMYAPENRFLEKVASLAKKNSSLLIFDEVITGFRLSLGGAQSFFSVTPDISVFGKAMANGYPISVVVGKKKILESVEERVFISSTYAGDLLSISAAIKTIHILTRDNVCAHNLRLGEKLKAGFTAAIQAQKINASCEGLPHKIFLVFRDANGFSGKEIEAYFRQQCFLKGAFLGYGHFISFSHTDSDIRTTLAIAEESFHDIHTALTKGNLRKRLQGSVAGDVIKRY